MIKTKLKSAIIITLLFSAMICILSINMYPVNGLGIGAEIRKKDITVILDVTADYSQHTLLKLIARTITWMIKTYYYYHFGETINSEEILRERLIAAIDYTTSGVYVDPNRITISLNPGLEETTLRVKFLIRDAVKFVNRSISPAYRLIKVKDTYIANLKWRSFYSPIELSSDFHENFKEILIAMGIYYLKNLLINGTLIALYNLIMAYSADFIKTVIKQLMNDTTRNIFYSKIVKPFEDFLRSHNMAYLVNAINNISSVTYEFIETLKEYPIINGLIDYIISAGMHGIQLIEQLWENIQNYLSFLIPNSIKEFIDNFGFPLFIAGLSLSFIGLHFNISSKHLKWLTNIVIDVGKFFDKVSYLLDHPNQLKRAYYMLSTKQGIIKLVGDYFGSMLLNMTGFSQCLEKWELKYTEDAAFLYFAIPVYVVNILGEPLIIDPEAKITLPRNIIPSNIIRHGDYVIYTIYGEIKDYPYDEIIPNFWLINNIIAPLVLLLFSFNVINLIRRNNVKRKYPKGLRTL